MLRRERDQALASKKNEYARRPTSYKSSLSLAMPVGTTRDRRTPSPEKKYVDVKTAAPAKKKEEAPKAEKKTAKKVAKKAATKKKTAKKKVTKKAAKKKVAKKARGKKKVT